MNADPTPLRFHWCFDAADSKGPGNAARAGVFESAMVEPAAGSREAIERAVRRASEIPGLKMTIPFRWDAMAAEEFTPFLAEKRVLWNAACARLPFALRSGPPPAEEWHRPAGAFLKQFGALPGGESMPLHVYGNSSEAAVLAIKYAACLWRLAAAPENTYSFALPVLHFGKEVGLVMGLAVRPSREEAREAVRAELPDEPPEWVTRTLFRSPGWPVNAPVLAGSYEDAARSIMAWKGVGVSQFLFAAADSTMEMGHFASGVLPLIREKEAAETQTCQNY